MADTIETAREAAVAFDSLVGNTNPPEPTLTVPEPSGDGLVEEMRGTVERDPNAEPTAEEIAASPELDTPGEVLEKLRKAQQDAGKAGYNLGKAREELTEKDQLIASYEARLAALESGQSPSQAEAQSQLVLLSDDQLDAFMGKLDRDWSEKREDPYMKQAAQYAASISVEAVKQLRREMSGVVGGVQDMQFNQRLAELHISRPQFDAVWEDPAYAWGATLTDDARLAALESQAGRSGAQPSQQVAQGQYPSVPGARPTSRVHPRTIETSQAPSQAYNPTTLRTLELDKALESGDRQAAKRAATPLFEALL